MRCLTLALLLALESACRCRAPIEMTDPPRLVARPERLVLPPAFVGQTTTATIELIDEGGAPVKGEVTVDAPFSTPTSQLELGRGEAIIVTVHFTPTAPGLSTGTLVAAGLPIPLEGEGLAAPSCVPSGVCVNSTLDFTTGQCREARLADGTTCQTPCVRGACDEGVCVGSLVGCDDSNACTVDACDEATGCAHTPRQCPPAAQPCRVATCSADAGCGDEEAPDGTLCGPDDCSSGSVDVCITGQCVRRVRPDTGRCANRWVATTITARPSAAMAWDSARGRHVLFGGTRQADTWEWNGARWSRRHPAAAPPDEGSASLAWDAARARAVLVARDTATGSSTTWEWDGVTWLFRPTASAPPGRLSAALAWDAARQRVVLFGGQAATDLGDTWLWDGHTWTQAQPPTSPGARYGASMAWDARRQRLVLFGGSSGAQALTDTWEWDGVTWRLASTSAPAARLSQLVFDDRRGHVLRVSNGAGPMELSEWDGSRWASIAAAAPPPQDVLAASWDSARGRLVVFAFPAHTWEWDGSAWAEMTHHPALEVGTMVGDVGRQRVVLFGSRDQHAPAETWEWDGQAWSAQQAPGPPARAAAALAWDATRQRVLLFGGQNDAGLLDDTWEWSGAAWSRKTPATSPSARRGHAMAFDAARSRIVLFGGHDSAELDDTWEWDGATWQRLTSATSPGPRQEHAMVYDPVARHVLVIGGVVPCSTCSGVPTDEVWAWNGASWAAQPTLAPESGWYEAALDEPRQTVVAFGGGALTTPVRRTLERTGTTWTRRMPVETPVTFEQRPVAFDAVQRRVVLFDGSTLWVWLP